MPNKRTWILVWIAAIVPLLGWWTYGLFDLDEGFYGAITAEMNRRHEWITPYYNGQPWFEKPILLYWAAKPALLLFGTTFGPRVPSVIATVAMLGLIAWFLKRNGSERAAQIGVLAYGTCLLPVGAGRMMLTDPLLVLCLIGTFLTFFQSLVGDRRWRIASAALLGCSVLAKGPVGCALFVIVAGIAYWRMPMLRAAFKGYWAVGTFAFLAVVATWYLPAYLVHRQVFVQKFLVEQNLDRFTGGDAAHTIGGIGGLLFYVPFILLGTLPWIVWAVRPLVGHSSASPDDREGGSALRTYLSICFWVVFVFFTISGAKLIHYVLPCVAPVAMLAALELDSRIQRDGTPTMQRLLIGGATWSVALWAIAQWVFSSYYYGVELFGQRLPGFHAEVHRIGRYVAERKGPDEAVAIYQMSRREKDLGTGKPKIQETTHPSLLMVMNQTALETDDFSEILALRRPTWIITRWNRIGPEQQREAAAANEVLVRVTTPFPQDMYALYRVGIHANPAPLSRVQARPGTP